MRNINGAQKYLLVVCLLLLSSLACAEPVSNPEVVSGWRDKPLVHGQHYMIVTNNPLASKAAKYILQNKGNAVDAAIAAAFVLGVTEPQSSGLGGGGYALTYQADQQTLWAYDGRERAPQSATPQWFLDEHGQPLRFEKAWLSPRSVGVPGEVAMLYLMHQKEGHLPWEALLQPAISLASKGFSMQPRLFTLLNQERAILTQNKQIKAIYFTSKGNVKPVGSLVKNMALAKVLQDITKQPTALYQGKIAQDILHAVNHLSDKPLYQPNDLKNYSALIKPALCDTFRHNRVCTVPPSAGGIAVLELLKLYAAHEDGPQNLKEARWVYTFLQASKLMFADYYRYIADPLFVHQSITGLLADDYVKLRSQLITEKAIQGDVAPGVLKGIQWNYASDNQFQPYGTTSLTIVDSQGNAVAMSLSIEHQFGSHIMVDGFFLNNELTDFSFKPQNSQGQWIANRVEAFKRPRSAMSPVMVFDQHQQLQVLAASPGGTQIICYVAKNLIQMLDFDWNPQQSAASGNLCVMNHQPVFEAHSALISFIPALEKQGESIRVSAQLNSGETNIKRDPQGGWWGSADPRREGMAIGD